MQSCSLVDLCMQGYQSQSTSITYSTALECTSITCKQNYCARSRPRSDSCKTKTKTTDLKTKAKTKTTKECPRGTSRPRPRPKDNTTAFELLNQKWKSAHSWTQMQHMWQKLD